jgi:ABC-type branched-subunit amino acid transport system substrate-binding protein/LysM repeat protein
MIYHLRQKFNWFLFLLALATLGAGTGISAQTLSPKDTANVHFLNSRKFYIYKVEKGETLYNISQRFRIPQEEILQFNHEAKDGLKAKMKLWIPAYSWLKKDSAELKQAVPVLVPDSEYRVAVITSFNLPLLYTAPDTSDSFVDERISEELMQNLEFTEGVLHAAELWKSEGKKVRLYILDAENDSSKLLRKLRKQAKPDFIITNQNYSVLKAVSRYSLLHQVNLLSCAVNSSEIVGDNKYAISLVPSSNRQCELMGRFTSDYFRNASLILLKTSSARENDRSDAFREGWLRMNGSPVKQVNYEAVGSGIVAESLVTGKKNIVFIASSNEDMVSSILNSLKAKIPDYNVTVIGLPTWQYFETIDQHLIELNNVHVFNSGFIDLNNNEVYRFRKYFRDKYYSEPTDYAYQGYDAFVIFSKFISTDSTKMNDGEKPFQVKGIYSVYSFERDSVGSAMENSKIHVFQPAGDLSIDLARNFKFK